MRRILFYDFHDADGIVDEYVTHLLRALREHSERIVVVARGALTDSGRIALEAVSDAVVVTHGSCSIADGRRAAVAHVADDLASYDELLLLDSSFFGPVFPFTEALERMAESPAESWTMTDDASAWLAVRPSVFTAPGWIADARSSQHEHLTDLGFTRTVAFPVGDYPTDEPSFESAHLLLRDGCPILSRRIFLEDPARLDRTAVLGRRMLTELERTDYPLDLVWRGIVRAAEPRDVHTNLSLLEILPEADTGWRPSAPPRIAVCAHVYYDDMIAEIMGYVANIPVPYHLDITTDTEAKRLSILHRLEPFGLDDVTVRVVESNQGRDTSALLIAQRDVLLSGDYDLVCRIHSKKSPQDHYNASDLFRSHMYDNLLPSPGYVAEVLRLFEEHPTLGMVFPPVVNIAYPTLGHAWFANREPAHALAQRLGIRTKFDSSTPIAPYGSMFWARPEGLRKLVEPDWQWGDFPKDGEYKDGSLTHVLERLLAYAVLDAGFHVRSIINRDWGSINYTFLEYKLQRVSSLLPAQTEDQVRQLTRPPLEIPLLAEVKQRFTRRYPRLGARVRPAYSIARGSYRRLRPGRPASDE